MDGLPEAVIFDLDGTLISNEYLKPLLDPPRYDEYHELSQDAKPKWHVLDELDVWAESGLDVLLVTARSNKYRSSTQDWLERYMIPYASLIMRGEHDEREDALVKRDLYMTHIEGRYAVRMAYEDKPEVVQMYQEFGLHTFLVSA